jgi:hypothetical protein
VEAGAVVAARACDSAPSAVVWSTGCALEGQIVYCWRHLFGRFLDCAIAVLDEEIDEVGYRAADLLWHRVRVRLTRPASAVLKFRQIAPKYGG